MRALLPTLLLAAACRSRDGPRLPESEPGWGAVFWRDGAAWRTGGSDLLAGPRAVARGRATGRTGPCGVEVAGAPADAVLALPPEADPAAEPARPPAVPAATVERAGWRLAEVLPPPGPGEDVAPAGAEPPARQGGVRVGSVVKVRRRGAPPVLLVGGARGCAGALVVADRDAGRVLAGASFEGFCGLPRVLPPADLDGDGRRETALFDGEQVVAFRLEETPGSISLRPLGGWRCPREAP